MKDDIDVALGQEVRDGISGMTGIVTKIGEHIAGCTRVCVRPTDVSETSRGSDEFFYPEQLETIEEETEFTERAERAITESDIELGQRVEDEITEFRGVASVINYSIWNCPQVLVQSRSDTENAYWHDSVRLKAVSDYAEYSFQDVSEQIAETNNADPVSTTGAGEDSQARNESRF